MTAPETSLPATLPDAPGSTTDRSRSSTRGLDLALLAAVGVVVLLVSVPRLGDYARRSNELDARSALRLLAASALEPGPSATGAIGATYLTDDVLCHRLQDARVLEDGRKLRYHGYYYAVVQRPNEPVLVAWPCNQGQSGKEIYALGSDGRLYAHPDPPQFEFQRDLSPPSLAQVWKPITND